MNAAAPQARLEAAADAAEAFLADLVDGLRRAQKTLPCKYFYDAAGSALFEEICELDEYYLTRTELGILRAHLPEIAQRLGARCAVVEYGSGSGTKTELLLDALKDPVAWVPIDISRSALASSAERIAARYPDLDVLPVCADYTAALRLPRIPRGAARRVGFFPGSTIGNFAPAEASAFLAGAARSCGPDGAILIGVDLEKDARVLERAYDDAAGVTARFNLNILARANRELGADFDLRAFRHRARFVPDAAGAGRIEMHLVSARAQRVHVGARSFDFARGESIHTECSYKWRLDALDALARGAGLARSASWTDPRGWFAVLLLEPLAQPALRAQREGAT